MDQSLVKNIIGQIFTSNNYGDFLVESKNYKTDYYNIRFIKTGYKTKAKYGNIIKGSVKDYILPTICGLGYLGANYEHICTDRDLTRALYARWVSMFKRCYDTKYKWYSSYGEKGVSVTSRWHSFVNFYSDAQNLNGYNRDMILDKNKLQLDKDLYQLNVPICDKVYSKDTCCWLSPSDNNNLKYITN